MNATELKTLRRLIGENLDEIIDAAIEADTENMANLDPHYNHAVLVSIDSTGSLDVSTTTVRDPGYTGAYESYGWILYVSRMGGDDLMDCIAFSELNLPDDDEAHDYDAKRDAVIKEAMNDFAEFARHDNPYSDDLTAALAELDSEIKESEPLYDLRNGSEKITELDPEESGYHPHILYNRQEAESLLVKWRDLLGDPDLDFEDVWIDTNDEYYRTEYLGLGKRDSYNTLL